MNNDMWPESRIRWIVGALRRGIHHGKLRICFAPSHESMHLKYFPDDIITEIAGSVNTGSTELVESPVDCDVFIFTSHGADLSTSLWNLRERAVDAVFAGWFWDNHVHRTENLATALASDIIFPSHKYAEAYLHNPVSVLGPHNPACCVQWSAHEADKYFRESAALPRSNQLLVNYVNYPFSWRHGFLKELENHMNEADVYLMRPNDRSRYFNKTRSARIREWCSYKVALVLPLENDLSTRVFDGLVAGQVLLIPERVVDLDSVIDPDMQIKLGIVRFDASDIPTVRDAYRKALTLFDKLGVEGMQRRHDFAMKNHMLSNRIKSMVDTIIAVASGEIEIRFRGSPFGLDLIYPHEQ